MNNWAYQYYRNDLDPNLQAVYDTIVKSCLVLERSVRLPPFLSKKSIEEVLLAIIKDHPEIFWVDYSKVVIKKSLFDTILIFNIYYSEQRVHQLSAEAIAWKTEIVSKLPSCFSNKDKAWLLFDYLARQVSYGKQSDSSSQTIIGPLSKSHVSVCEGIAKSYKFLCDKAGIPCIVVFGKAYNDTSVGEHAWNIIETESGYKHVDVTAELCHAQKKGIATQTGFLHSDSDMYQYQWDQSHTPSCK